MLSFKPFPNVEGGFCGRLTPDLSKRLDTYAQLTQVHEDTVHLVREPISVQNLRTIQGDALISTVIGQPIAVRVADCVPILIADPAGAVAAVHAGWRGTKLEIVLKTLFEMKAKLDSDLSRLNAWIGPAICGNCYEVGEEVREHFIRFGEPFVRRQKTSEKFLIDLKSINANLLEKAGIPKQQIKQSSECTLCNQARFFSHRGNQKRQEGENGRNLAWIKLVF